MQPFSCSLNDFNENLNSIAYSEIRDDSLVCMEATQKFEKKYNIKQHLLTTISSVETGRWNAEKQQNVAWPWTVNARGKGMFFKTKAEAVRAVKRLQKEGVKSIDVGCMQINLAYHPDAFKSVEEAFDPQKNVEYSAKFLTNLYENRGKDWIKAAMAYHSSVPRKAQRYRKKLASAYEMVKQAHNNAQKAIKLAEGARQQPVQKVERSRNVVTKKQEARTVAAREANAWREAKLEEYRQSKLNNL